jgi:hypothetical protein
MGVVDVRKELRDVHLDQRFRAKMLQRIRLYSPLTNSSVQVIWERQRLQQLGVDKLLQPF